MTGGRRGVALVVTGALGGLLAACSDCGADPADGAGGSATLSTSSSTSDTTASSSATSTTATATTGSVDPNGCSILPYPPEVPDGWIEWTDWSCDCRLYIPGSKAAMPAAVEWEPCPPAFGDVDCRRMKPWTTAKVATAVRAWADKNPDGSAILKFRRVAADAPNPYVVDLVADADGPVRSAIMWPPASVKKAANFENPGCNTYVENLAEGHDVSKVDGDSIQGDYLTTEHEGAIARAIDDPAPRVLAHYVDDKTYGWDVSANWVFRSELPSFSFYAMPWSMTPETFVTSPAVDPDHLHSDAHEVPIGDALFWVTNSDAFAGINVWDPVNGARPFIRWPGDTTKGAADFGTDGADMVWSYGEGQIPNQEFGYEVQSIMTAKFTTDPAAVVAKRLRSFQGRVGMYPFQVGCGYAAVQGNLYDLWIVRLSDSVAWHVTGPGGGVNALDGGPIGVTCDDVFVLGHFGGQSNIARFRISSLGPGMPPD